MSARAVERVAEAGLFAAAAGGVGLLLSVVGVVAVRGVLALGAVDLAAVLRPTLATALVSGVAATLCLPVALGAAVWMRHLARGWSRVVARDAFRALEQIPTVVFGFVGLVGIVPVVARFGPYDGRTGLAASLVLALMALPTVVLHVESALGRVPAEQLEAARALGATRLQAATRVALPAAWPGVLAGLAAGVARALGDTMIVLMVAGATAGAVGLLGPAEPLSAAIVRGFGGQGADALGLVLLVASLALTVAVERRRR